MLIHEIPEGGYGTVDGKLFVRPPGAKIATIIPEHVQVIREGDGTLTLRGPIYCQGDSHLSACFLIHDSWHCLEIGRR